MYGAVDFYRAAVNAGVKPIIGVETYVAPRRHTDRDAKVDANPHHLILLANNAIGYRNLLALVTKAHLDGYYYKPRIDKELLAQHAEGLIGTSACLGGEVLKRLADADERGARQAADDYRSILGDGNFFIEVQDHGLTEQRILHPKLVELARGHEACRCWPPTTPTTPCRSRPMRTTCCCASRPGRTARRPTG